MSSIKRLFLYLPLLLLPMLACVGCSSDDDEVYDDNLTGKWDLVEIKDGPEGRCEEGYVQRYSSGTVIIEIKDGQIVFNYQDGKKETMSYSIPKNQELYYSSLPVMLIGEVPFSYVIEKNRLYLHYCGICTCDHSPATFVFKRIK